MGTYQRSHGSGIERSPGPGKKGRLGYHRPTRWSGTLGFPGIEQEAFQTLCELIAASQKTPTPRHFFVVNAYGFVRCLGRTPLGIGCLR